MYSKPTLLLFFILSVVFNSWSGIKDTPFVQEYHEAYPDPRVTDVRAIAVDRDQRVWAGCKSGLYVLESGAWTVASPDITGPVYDICIESNQDIWVAAWNGLYQIQREPFLVTKHLAESVSVICKENKRGLAIGPDAAWEWQSNKWVQLPRQWSFNVCDAILDASGHFWIASGLGLYTWDGKTVRHFYKEDEITSSEVNGMAFSPSGQLWIAALGGIDVFEDNKQVRHFSGKEGLPYYDVRVVRFDADGVLWAGTGLGVARYDGATWSLRHSHRWLLSDDVRDLAFDQQGTAWVATAAGVSAIKKRTMTLLGKADFYHKILLARHVREPGLVEKCRFPDPNNREVFVPQDDDNDGQYTSLYIAMECFRYAVTKDPQAKELADRAFQALVFLQTVTGTQGFIARTVIPSDWTSMADPNEIISARTAVERRVRDPRYKPVETRWRASSDGKWLWKGDTSSDEITGHFYAFLLYYDLVADDAQKIEVRKHAARVMDAIIDGGYVLRDLDGKPTRWGVWAPEYLNDDPDWRVEKPINSMEILSYLKTTYHITGNEKYQKEYERLIHEHGYAKNCRYPKSYGRADRTYIDDELLALTAPALLLYEKDLELLDGYRKGMEWAYRTVENDWNPYFNFTYGFMGGKDFHLDESVSFLRDQPLDLIQWTVDNAGREDIQLVRFPMIEPLQISRMLPASERGVMRWDKNPWTAQSGDFHDPNGQLESSGVFWLLPYWLGRYCGYIE